MTIKMPTIATPKISFAPPVVSDQQQQPSPVTPLQPIPQRTAPIPILPRPTSGLTALAATILSPPDNQQVRLTPPLTARYRRQVSSTPLQLSPHVSPSATPAPPTETKAESRTCGSKSCSRTIPSDMLGSVCEKCRNKIKRHQAQAKQKFKLEPKKMIHARAVVGTKESEEAMDVDVDGTV